MDKDSRVESQRQKVQYIFKNEEKNVKKIGIDRYTYSYIYRYINISI